MPPETNRYYRLNGTGHLAYAEWIEATSDEEAIELVEAKYPSEKSEVWLGNRCVARIYPKQFDPDNRELQEAVAKRLSALADRVRHGQEASARTSNVRNGSIVAGTGRKRTFGFG